MRTIEIDEEIYRRLFSYSEGFDDTVNDVIRRLLNRIDTGGPDASVAPPRRRTTRYIKRGERTPQEAFDLPILRALEGLGGSGSVRQVLEVVGREMSAHFNEADLLPLPSTGEPRWRNAARWDRQTLVDRGLLDAASPRGIWQLTEDGRRYLERETRQDS
jgi:hypothetical protein